MKKLALALCIVAAPAFAQGTAAQPAKDAKAAGTEMKQDMKAAGGDMKAAGADMMGWVPRKVTKEDKKGLDAMFKEMEAAWKAGDVNAAAALTDFPVYMVTDDSQGKVYTDMWDRAKYVQTMGDAMKNMPKDMMPKTTRKYTFLTDTMAMVTEDHTMTMGGKKMQTRTACLAINKDGKWMLKSSVEGGWGDSMKNKGATGGAGSTTTMPATTPSTSPTTTTPSGTTPAPKK
jgi:hypothetical protein